MRIRITKARLMAFYREEAGASYVGASFALITVAASIPLGFAFLQIYRAIYLGGLSACFTLGLF